MEPKQQHGAGSQPQRPSLMGTSASTGNLGAGKSAPSVRLLDAIERETTARSPSGRRKSSVGWLLGGTGLLAAAAGWLWLGGAAPSATGRPELALASAPVASAPAAALPPASTAAVTAAVASAPVDALVAAAPDSAVALAAEDAGSGAARIERLASATDTAAPTGQPTAVGAAAVLASGSLAERGTTAETPETSAAAKARPETRAEPRKDTKKAKATTGNDRALATATPAANSKTRAVAARDVAAVKAKPAAKPAARRPHETDPDADVVAAIMASLDKRGASPLAAFPSAPASPAGTTTRSASSIAELVSRCNSLADEEMLACRRRICDGYWGKAQACPASLSPQASAHP